MMPNINPNLTQNMAAFTNTGATPPMANAVATTGVGSGGPSFMERFRTMDPNKQKLITTLLAQGLGGLANPKGVSGTSGLSPQMLQAAMGGGMGGF